MTCRRLRSGWPLVLIEFLCICSLDACRAKVPGVAPTVEVGTVTLRAQPVIMRTELIGRTTAHLISDVRPQVAGIIRARRFTEGSMVHEGEVLYEIDPAPYIAARDQAQADLLNEESAVDAARLKSERYGDLVSMQGVSKQDADDANTAYAQAKARVAKQRAALETARINVGYTRIRAPITGRIGISSTTPGALVTASQTDPMATIRALDPIYVDVTQSSASLLRLRKMLKEGGALAASTEVSLTLEDGSSYPLPGTLQFAEVAVDKTTGSVTLRAEFPNPDETLLPGMFVRAVLNEAVDPAGVLAPQQGVLRNVKGNATAFIVNAENRIEQRDVETRRAIGDKWLIARGLKAGDRLVVQGTNKVRVGDPVRAIDLEGGTGAAKPAAVATQ
jgi:membrane fusion protein (multidrug efflux system)